MNLFDVAKDILQGYTICSKDILLSFFKKFGILKNMGNDDKIIPITPQFDGGLVSTIPKKIDEEALRKSIRRMGDIIEENNKIEEDYIKKHLISKP